MIKCEYMSLLHSQIVAIENGYKTVLRVPCRKEYDFKIGTVIAVSDFITGKFSIPMLKIRILSKSESQLPDDIAAFSWEDLSKEGISNGIKWTNYYERQQNDPDFCDPWGNPFGCSHGNHSAACRAMRELQRTWNALFYPDVYFPSKECQQSIIDNTIEPIQMQPVSLPKIYIYEFERIKEN